MSYRKPWHRDQGDPDYCDAPEMPESYVDDHANDHDVTIEDMGKGEGWAIYVKWGGKLVYEDWTDREEEAQSMVDDYLRASAIKEWDQYVEEGPHYEP